MLANKMDLRVAVITFTLNSKKQLYSNILEDYFSSKNKNRIEAKKELYRIINSRCKINTYDEIDLLIKKYHRDLNNQDYKNNNYLYYYKLISNIAKSFISHRDGKIILKYWESKEDKFLEEYKSLNKIAMWNTLSREVNIDTIVFQYMLDNGMEDYRCLQYYHSLVHIEDLQLERVLSKGVAETHMHIGAGINFEIKWHDLMNTEVSKGEPENYNILDISIGEGIENYNLKIYRYIAIIYRVILSKFIFSYYPNNLQEFLNKFQILYDENLLDLVHKILNFDDEVIENIKSITKNIKLMMNANNRVNFSNIHYHGYSYYLNNNDFLSSIITNVDLKIDTTLENIFIFESLKYIKNNGQKDKLFCDIFYKYILIKNIFYRVSTQDNSIKGLDRFSMSFKRSTHMLNKKNKTYLVLHTQTKNRNLKKFEIRSSFPNVKSERKLKTELKKDLREFFKIYLDLIENEYNIENIPQIGIVYSFKKYKDDEEKCWLEHIETDDITRLYYENNRIKYLNQLNILLELREEVPYLSNYIVGIDAASIENNTEPWVFAPVFKRARNSSRKIGILYSNREYKTLQQSINTLGFTFHVGEEFRHILSGLRRIDEVIEHLNFKSGDRIGHGIALGIDINKWAKNNSVIIIPRIEYLENLLWIWGILTKYKSNYNKDINYIERKIINEAKQIYSEEHSYELKGIDVYMLYDVYISKFKDTHIIDKYGYDKNNKCECSYKCSYKNQYSDIFCKNMNYVHRNNWDKDKMIYSFHCSQYLDRMTEPIEVIVEDLDLLQFVQDKVKRKIATKGIIVETNPTSNRSIGELENIFEHYITNLNNVSKLDNNIMVSINTDDPCVFNTNINNEYAYIFYSLIKKGYNRNICLEWIDNVRKIAIDQSFIKTRDISNVEIKEEIDEIIKYLE